MSDDSPINSEETPMPEAPKGAHTSLKPNAIKNPGNGNNGNYLNEKSDITSPEGLLNRFKEMSETDDPVNAILVTEVQEVKGYVARTAQMSAITVTMLAVLCVYVIYTMKEKS